MAPTLLNELDVWGLRSKMAEIYAAKLENQMQNYVDNIMCTHIDPNNRTCTDYVCANNCLTSNDKTIIKSAFEIFMLLSKLKELCPDHKVIIDFAEKIAPSQSKKRLQPKIAQVVPLDNTRSETYIENNEEYSILNDSDDKSARDDYYKDDSSGENQSWCKRCYNSIK